MQEDNKKKENSFFTQLKINWNKMNTKHQIKLLAALSFFLLWLIFEVYCLIKYGIFVAAVMFIVISAIYCLIDWLRKPITIKFKEKKK